MWMKSIAIFIFCTALCSAATDNPCKGFVCSGGRSCAMDKDQRPVCVCLLQCQPYYYYPVCGSDNKTYDNECQLETQSCITNRRIIFRSYGICAKRDACDGFSCPYGKTCRVDPKSKRPVCVCDVNCDYSGYRARVCGSDNTTYNNVCELKKQACFSGSNITVAYQGDCVQATVCDRHNCTAGRYCAVGERGQPVCVCNTTCPSETDKAVCGSDGTTYLSVCQLRTVACTSGVNITVAHPGYCYTGSVCSGIKCPLGKLCTVDENNRPMCVCKESCTYTYDPVCGSNGQTYSNECYFLREACLQKDNSTLTVAYKGICRTCTDNPCPYPKRCEVDEDNSTRCVCIDYCSQYYYPVCGSDNRTYDNECQMRMETCKAGRNVTVALNGTCLYEGFGCEQYRCPYGKHCVVDAKNRPSCVCDKNCYDYYSPVCGSDNRTYYSWCELQRFSCMSNINVTSKYYGTCEGNYTYNSPCSQKSCPYGSHCEYNGGIASCVCDKFCPNVSAPVCGTDNKTYQSNCHLRMKACKNQTTATGISRQGSCQPGSSCEDFYCSYDKHCELDKNKQPVCVCDRACPLYYDPICGSDNKTYPNSCELRVARCLANSSLYQAFSGTCERGPGCYGQDSCGVDRTCVVDENNRPHCVCNGNCFWSLGSYVCGSDNKTYASSCFLRFAACVENKNITVASYDKCSVGSPDVHDCLQSTQL